ncbi:MAG: peptidase T [Acidobacteriota bacterium]|nr:peptidase T [Acidobacteriota bacterium]
MAIPDSASLTADCVARFLRYVTVDTRSDETSSTYPSTPGQLTLLRQLTEELRDLGLSDAAMDEHGYVMATVPATPGREHAPVIGLVAHVDTSPEMSGTNVKPIVHRNYDGRDLALPDDPAAVIRVQDCPALAGRKGDDVITASGLTLLGADDKAGVAAIMAAAAWLVAHPQTPHGPIRVAFTPDEEVGRGTKYFDVARFNARCAYTLDGGDVGDLEYESFSADVMTLAFQGFNTHPGYAKGRMVNAIKMAADFIARLPEGRLSPETTEGYEGYVHPYVVQAAVDRTSVRVLLRDFTRDGLREQAALIERLAQETVEKFPGGSVKATLEEQYRNMREVIDRHPEIVERAAEAMRRTGLAPRIKPIRGGTDGSKLSFMGLPTPNLFAGEHNIHSRLEWTSAGDLARAAEVVVHLCQIWAEQA